MVPAAGPETVRKARTRRVIIRLLKIFLMAAFLSAWPLTAAAQEFTGRVAWVYDGDSIRVISRSGSIVVRVFGIDCPERGQPYSRKALKFTMHLARNLTVTVLVKDQDRYGRVVGRVILPDGRDLGRELVRAGLAWRHRRFAPDDKTLKALEAEARSAGRGLWRDPKPVPPWVFKAQGPG